MQETLLDEFQVYTSNGWEKAELVCDRPRSRILKLADGQIVKIVKGSARVREDPRTDPELSVWLMRNRRSWRHLRRQTHPGLLRVGERVVDHLGDEGHVCQGLDVCELQDPAHPARRNLRAFLQCAIRLSEAAGVMHQAGFVHGDITPSNVCFHQDFPVLIDYEMTVRIGRYISPDAEDPHYRAICCTPDCCSPEHVLRQPVTPATDVFCLALTMLSWISGCAGVSHTRTIQSVQESMSLCAHGVYPHWEVVEARVGEPAVIDVLRRCLCVTPSSRYENGDELARVLDELLRTRSQETLDRSLGNETLRVSASPNLTLCLGSI